MSFQRPELRPSSTTDFETTDRPDGFVVIQTTNKRCLIPRSMVVRSQSENVTPNTLPPLHLDEYRMICDARKRNIAGLLEPLAWKEPSRSVRFSVYTLITALLIAIGKFMIHYTFVLFGYIQEIIGALEHRLSQCQGFGQSRGTCVQDTSRWHDLFW